MAVLTPPPRRPSRLEVWAWGPVIVLRAALVATYLLYCYLSAIAFVAGIPAFDLTSPPGYTSVWAFVMGTGAVVAAVGSLTDRWQRFEKWGALAVFATMLGWVGTLHVLGFASGDVKRQAVAAGLTIALVLPFVRFVYLAAQSGKLRRRPQ
jgi:hypothetical protein